VDLRNARLRSLSAGVLSALGFDVRTGVRLTPDACLFVIEADARERVLAATARRELPILVVGEPAEPRFVHGTTATPLTRLYGRVAGEQPELDLDEEGRFAGAGRP
jgi:hypothetical protein